MIRGCVCDEGYEGYDCSLVMCPTGDDPETTDQRHETQMVRCIADSGAFTASFRSETTPLGVQFDATAAEFKAVLESLPSVHARMWPCIVALGR